MDVEELIEKLNPHLDAARRVLFSGYPQLPGEWKWSAIVGDVVFVSVLDDQYFLANLRFDQERIDSLPHKDRLALHGIVSRQIEILKKILIEYEELESILES